jgi:GT2 family glycosyltransferase
MPLKPAPRSLVLLVPGLGASTLPASPETLALLIRQAERLVPGCELVVAGASDTAARAHDAGPVLRVSDRGALATAAAAADAIVLGPGQLVAPAGELDDDAFVGPRAESLPFAIGLACLGALVGRPVVVLGAQADDPDDASVASLLRALCELASFIGGIDEASCAVLARHGAAATGVWTTADPDIDVNAMRSATTRSATTTALVDRLEPALRRAMWDRHVDLEQRLASTKRSLQERDEDNSQLRGEVALAKAERRGREALEAELLEIKGSRAWRTLDQYRLLRARARAFRERRPWHPPAQVPLEPLDTRIAPLAASATKHDVVCFSIIDWESRWQRPQQLVSKFADNGHRVFYVRMSGFLPRGGRPYELTELRDNVWAVKIATRVHPRVYERPIDPVVTEEFIDALAALRSEHDVDLAVALVQIPTWRPIAESAREHFGWPVVYDCMDEWAGFPGVAAEVLEDEAALARSADVVTVSARRLLEKFGHLDRPAVLARNAADFGHFAGAEPTSGLNDASRPVLGYFGVIDKWFDIDLVVALAQNRPDATIVLIGNAEVDVRALDRLANVRLLGLRPYAEMPGYLARFDACLIPFLINETTAAADQVKFYEYISQGKPVVSTLLPELEPFREHLYLTADREEFLAAVDAAAVEDDPDERARRVELARANDWQARYEVIERAVSETMPCLSVVVVTYGNRALTEQCIAQLQANTGQPRFELVIVDNASDDGTPEYLRASAAADDRLHVILNDENRGFAAAVNQGLEAARGDVLVIMNNDVVVPPAWHVPVLRHLERPDVGLVTATTNNAGNEAQVTITYTDFDEMAAFAAKRRRARDGSWFDLKVAVMYCVAMRREVFAAVGPLDERFGIGWFEDDDYSHRVRIAGYRVICADDAFVHHHGQAAFSTIGAYDRQLLWQENQLRFEEKWGMAWEAPAPRPDLVDAPPEPHP